MNPTIIVVAFLVLFALVLLTIGLGMRLVEAEKKQRVTRTLRTVGEVTESPRVNILSDQEEGARQTIAFSDLPFVKRLDAGIHQAGLTWSPGGLLAAMATGAMIGILLGSRVAVPVYREAVMLGLACLFGTLPYLYVRMKRLKRLGAFEEQFPDTLDFLARSLRAGHAFSVSLEMLGNESPEPTGVEFRTLFHEQNLGAPIEVAMRNLSQRIPLLDVRFFVSAVLLQRTTGGNLAEILDKLAYVIRERFRLKGQVRAVSAHGRITATVLTIMPIVTMLALMFVAPSYLAYMANDEDGKWLIVGTIVAMLIGYYWMRRIIDIKV